MSTPTRSRALAVQALAEAVGAQQFAEAALEAAAWECIAAGLTYAEVGEIIGVSGSTVHRRLNK